MFNLDIVTTIIALIALGLSIINYLSDRKDKSANLEVKLIEGVLETKQKRKKFPSFEEGYLVEVINTGQPQVSIVDVRIIFTQRKNYFVEVPLKRALTKGSITKRTSNKKSGITFQNLKFWISMELHFLVEKMLTIGFLRKA